METKFLILLMILFLVSPTVVATPEEQCYEQLQVILDEYNYLQQEYVSGSNCGQIKISLTEQNFYLAEERSKLNAEVINLKSYKVGFYLLFIILIILAIQLASPWIKEMLKKDGYKTYKKYGKGRPKNSKKRKK